MKRVELYFQVRHAVRIEGLSERAAARRFGIDPRTVSKMLKFSVPPGYRRSKPAPRQAIATKCQALNKFARRYNIVKSGYACGLDPIVVVAFWDTYFMTDFSHDSAPTGAPPVKQRHRSLLETYGLRTTRQRLGLAKLLLSKGNRHVTADALAAEASSLKMRASLATVYNVLKLFAHVGIVRALTIEGAKTFFDTNTSDHSHFFYEDTGHIEDIPIQGMQYAGNVTPPEGYEIVKVDVVFRLRRKMSTSA